MSLFTTAPRHAKSASGGRVKQSDPAREERQEKASPERQVEIAAARLRVTLDRRLGRETPVEVKETAAEEF